LAKKSFKEVKKRQVLFQRPSVTFLRANPLGKADWVSNGEKETERNLSPTTQKNR
jgi:hypothetical protein